MGTFSHARTLLKRNSGKLDPTIVEQLRQWPVALSLGDLQTAMRMGTLYGQWEGAGTGRPPCQDAQTRPEAATLLSCKISTTLLLRYEGGGGEVLQE